MNLSRAYSLAYNEKFLLGRVQTPTPALVVERELAIRSFVPEDYLEVVADFRPSGGAPKVGAQQNIYRAQQTGRHQLADKHIPVGETRLSSHHHRRRVHPMVLRA